MANEKKEVVAHANIYAALAAFQSEMPEVKKTKRFGKEKDTMTFMYAPLDEFVKAVTPVTSKNGLSFTWQEGKEKGTMVCVLFHSTYEIAKVATKKSKATIPQEGSDVKVIEDEVFEDVEKNVIRSMAVKVRREGDMKGIGADSTYARRYTLGEVLGIASEDDNDVAYEASRLEKAEGFAFKQAMTQVTGAKDEKRLKEQVDFFNKELVAIKGGKAPSIGLKEEQYQELLKAAELRAKTLRGEVEPEIIPEAGQE